MRKTLLQFLLIPVILLVCSNVSVSRDEDRSPPGIESKMSFADLQDCQVQDYQVAEVPALVAPTQDIWRPESPWEIPKPTSTTCISLQLIKRTKTLYRWGEVDRPLRE